MTARRVAHEWWPNSAIRGELGQELPLPRHFEQAASMVTEDDVAEAVVCGPELEAHLAAIDEFAQAGFDHVYVHQVGPEQDGFFTFYEREVLPFSAPAATAWQRRARRSRGPGRRGACEPPRQEERTVVVYPGTRIGETSAAPFRRCVVSRRRTRG